VDLDVLKDEEEDDGERRETERKKGCGEEGMRMEEKDDRKGDTKGKWISSEKDKQYRTEVE
jgi:hypothetical protein